MITLKVLPTRLPQLPSLTIREDEMILIPGPIFLFLFFVFFSGAFPRYGFLIATSIPFLSFFLPVVLDTFG